MSHPSDSHPGDSDTSDPDTGHRQGAGGVIGPGVVVPGDGGGPVFAEPWQAQAFAIAVTLERRGVFNWSEWAQMLGDEIRAAEAAAGPDTGADYYRHWLATLERMVALKGLAGAEALARHRHALARAARRTPHGAPIEVRAEDF